MHIPLNTTDRSSTQNATAEHGEGSCTCRSECRRLAILSQHLLRDQSDLRKEAEALHLSLHPELDVLCMDIGPGSAWQTVAEALNFVRALMSPGSFELLRAVWLDTRVPLEKQVAKLLHAEPVANLTRIDNPQLLEILRTGSIETWFQPIVRAGTDDIWGYECLLRGRAEDGKLVSPAELIAWARQESLIFMLDRICRETHLRNAGKAAGGTSKHFTINFLPTSIYQPEFCLQSSMAAAKESGLKPEQVVFEVIETDNVTDVEHLRRILAFYRNNGFRVALDDVGTGYAGLSLLADLDPDLIKIARELVAQIDSSPMHRSICKALIDLGRDHGKPVLAEGVETVAQKAVLEELGVDLFQGYYFGKPAPDLATQVCSH